MTLPRPASAVVLPEVMRLLPRARAPRRTAASSMEAAPRSGVGLDELFARGYSA